MERKYLSGNIRERLQDLMKERKITQSELAAKIGMDVSTLSRFISNATGKLGDENIKKIAKEFEVSTDFLLGVTDIPDRMNYDIAELGLSVQAAKNLYTGKVNITESFSYGDEDSYYYITDMIEYNGNIYLSAYAVPRLANEDQSAGGRYEIAGVLNYLFDNNIWEISSDELTPMVRDNYTAMLLVCEPNAGKPQEYYSVNGSLGGKLSVSDTGNLLWDVESITSTFFSPATSSFTIGGTSYVFRYTFDTSGMLISQEKTGEVVNYRR